MVDRDSASDHSDRVAARRAARLMNAGGKSPVRDRQNGRPGPRPGRSAVEAIAAPGSKKPSRSRTRQEGWDEFAMVGLAVALAVIVAVVAIHQAIAWVRL
jgi:hypothetical protein